MVRGSLTDDLKRWAYDTEIVLGEGSVIGENADSSVAIGDGANVGDEHSQSIVIGKNATTSGTENPPFPDIVIGAFSTIEDESGANTLLGFDSDIGGEGSTTQNVLIGNNNSTTGSFASTGVGGNVDIQSSLSVAIGDGASIAEGAQSSIAIGDGAEATNEAEGHINADQLRFGGVEGTIPDEDLGNSELVFEIDEANNQLVARMKDSDGNLETASIDFDA